MTTRQPDWSTFNRIAADFIASTPLALRIAAATPVGGYVAKGLQLDLNDILAAAAKVAAPLSGVLVIAVDTLSISSGDTTISAPAVSIMARSVQVAGGGSGNLILRGESPTLQLTTAQIIGSLSVTLQGANGSPTGNGAPTALTLTGLKSPQVLTITADSPGDVVTEPDLVTVADVMHSPWSILALQISSAIAGVLVDRETSDDMALAEAMLRWVTGSCHALLLKQSYSTVNYADIASLQSSSIALLTFTQASASKATYVPILSPDMYQTQINGLLSLAEVYDGHIRDLNDQKNIDERLSSFATTLATINKQAAGPLLNTLSNLANETALVETQLKNAAVQLDQIGKTLPDLQEALQKAIEDQFQKELVQSALDTFFTVATLYVSMVAVVADPELLSLEGQKLLTASLDVTKSVLETAKEPLTSAITGGVKAAGDPPNTQSIQASQKGAQVQVASVVSFSQAANTLWALVGKAIAQAPNDDIDYSPDFLGNLKQVPDLSGFSIGGLDPVNYWKAIVVQTQASVQPHQDLSEATAYLTAVQLCATFGAAVGDLQMKLLDLYTQGMAAFTRLQEVYQAADEWHKLQSALLLQEQRVDAAIGLLQRGYLNLKRNLVVAVANYRAAFKYRWLQSSQINVDVSMDYKTLVTQALSSIDSLQKVLAGPTGKAVQPRQRFTDIRYTVSREGAPLFVEVNGQGQAQWSISVDEDSLSRQLGGNGAIYLTNATFVLEGAQQMDEVELEIQTSGHYGNRLGGSTFQFVSQAVSMNNLYRPSQPPTFITSWQFADASAYMAPTPYTNWTLTVIQGEWKQVTSITMTLSGVYLQNPSSARL